MDTDLQHGMDIPQNHGSRARARFVSGLRSYVLNNMAAELRQDYESNIEPAEFDEDTGRLSDSITWCGFGAKKSARG
jgi:hypothetical protein